MLIYGLADASNRVLCAIAVNMQICAQTAVRLNLKHFAFCLRVKMRANDGFVRLRANLRANDSRQRHNRSSTRRAEGSTSIVAIPRSFASLLTTRRDARSCLAPLELRPKIRVVVPAECGLTGKRGTQVSGIRDASKRSGPNVFWHLHGRHR